MEANMRECKACGGTGEVETERAVPIPDEPTRGHFWRCGTCHSQNSDMDGTCQFCECGGVHCTRWNCDDPKHFPICPACDGHGTQSDVMPVADLEADIETLRLARQYFTLDYKVGRVDAYEFVLAGNMLADATKG